jgi:hypothetical protein
VAGRTRLPTAILVAALHAAGTMAGARPPRLEFESPRELAGDVGELRWLPPERWEPALALVGLDDPGAPIHVVLLPEDHPVARRTPRWVSGFAVAEQDAVVLFPGRVVSYPDDSLSALLTHEVAHVLLARAAHGRPLPRWFQEGVAMLASRERQLADRQHLLVGGIQGVPPSTAALDRAFDGSGYGVDTAYAIAGALVEELVAQHGRGAIARIAAETAAGRPFPAAFAAASGTSLDAFEASFWRRFRWRYRWLPFLTSAATLWLAITALALVAIARRRQKDAAIRRRWDEEEALAAAAAAAVSAERRDEDLVSRYGPN